MVVKENSPRSFVGMRPNPKNFCSGDFSRTSSGRAYLPWASACQSSRQASGTGWPSPSSIRPRMVTRSPPNAPGVRSERFSQSMPMLKYGPTVCEGVVSPLMSSLHGSGVAATQHNIKSEAQGDLRSCRCPIENRNQALARGLHGHTVIDRVEFEQRIAGKIHLRHQPRGESGSEHGEMDVLGPPSVVVIAPGIRAGPDGDETVAAFVIREGLTHSREIGIERSVMLVRFVQITPGGVGLPNFHQRIRHGPAISIQQPAADNDALAQRLTFVLPRQIERFGRNDFLRKEWPGGFGERVGQLNQRPRGSTLDRGSIRRMQKLRLSTGGGPAISQHRHHSAFPSDAFENYGNPLANADAHGAKRVTSFSAQQLIERGGHQAPSARAKRMSDGDGAAIGIDVRGIVRQAKLAKNG